jgi:hypothetical protein
MATDANPNLETRATVLFFTFANRQDQIVALGARDYPATAGEFEAGQPCRARGTGRYRQIHGRSRPADQYAEMGWFVYAGVYAAQVIRDARRIGATSLAIRVGIEPNCLGWEKSIHLLIAVRP